jgi:hypothetical protein
MSGDPGEILFRDSDLLVRELTGAAVVAKHFLMSTARSGIGCVPQAGSRATLLSS